MNILHLRSSEFFGGPERAIVGQCKYLDKFDVICASFVRGDRRNQFLEECQSRGIKTVAIAESFPGDLRAVRRLKKEIANRGIDLIISHDYKANVFGYYAVKNCHARQAAHFRGWTASDLKDRIYNQLNWIYLRRIRRVITVSSASRQYLIGKGISGDTIVVVPNAIECDDSAPFRVSKSQAPDSEFRVVAAGRLSYEKGYDILLKAVALVKDKAPAFRLFIYGTGPEEANLRKSAEELGIGDLIEFAGFVDNIKPLFREADLMILPSRSEGMPNVILEAWSQRLPVLSTAVGGVPEMIQPGQNGLLVPSDDPQAMADMLSFAMFHTEEIVAYGEAGYETVREKYSYPKQSELLEKIYNDFLID